MITTPPLDRGATERAAIPFTLGVDAYRDGFPADFNLYDAGTRAHLSFAEGWRAAASVADAEAPCTLGPKPVGHDA